MAVVGRGQMGDFISPHERLHAGLPPILTSDPTRKGRRGMGFHREASDGLVGFTHANTFDGHHTSVGPTDNI